MKKRSVVRSVAVLAAASSVIGGAWATAPQADAATSAKGTVQCASGAIVAGVWVVAKNGGSGFARFTRSPGTPSYARFEYTLSRGGSYLVNVGCGLKSNGRDWKTNNTSTVYLSGTRTFLCYDVKVYAPKVPSNYAYQKCLAS
ncbi:MAG: hypothetical protein QM662_02690 [Gordonia sp. (in: high G+C Gram-positive bacteria)]